MEPTRRSVGPVGEDKLVWDACLLEAWKAACRVGEPVVREGELEVAQDPPEEADAIHVVLQAAIVLEGRLKQVLNYFDAAKNTPEVLRKKSLEGLMGAVKGTKDLWGKVKPNLDAQAQRDFDDMSKLRDAIAHANIIEIRKYMSGRLALTRAARIHNLVMDIMAMLNAAMDYWPDGYKGEKDWKLQGCLKLKVTLPEAR
jgi:hypothetical protein